MSMMTTLSRYVFNPLWDLKDGSKRLKYLRELERSQWLPQEELLARQQRQLREIVRYAGEKCPWYQRQFAAANFDSRNFSLDAFHRLPVLTKADIRAHTDEMIAAPYKRDELEFHKTGGSTGTSLQTHFDQDWLERRTADALRSDQWANCYHGMKIAAIWGNPPKADTLKLKIRGLLLDRFIYLDTMDINERTLGEFVALWRRELPEVLFGHSHSLYILARYLVEQNITDLRPLGIISTSMMLLQAEREVIEKAFGCRVTDRYGSEEVSLIACECEQHRGFHLNIEHLYIEFLRPDGTHAAPGEEGAIVITDLYNRGMPLIRYRIEDVGVPSARKCACGRGLPLMERVTGRVADYLKRLDGSLVAGVSLVERTLTVIPGVEQMQIVQLVPDELVLNVVRSPVHTAESDRQLLGEFRVVFGDQMRLRIEHVERIPQERSGKYRFSICKV